MSVSLSFIAHPGQLRLKTSISAKWLQNLMFYRNGGKYLALPKEGSELRLGPTAGDPLKAEFYLARALWIEMRDTSAIRASSDMLLPSA